MERPLGHGSSECYQAYWAELRSWGKGSLKQSASLATTAEQRARGGGMHLRRRLRAAWFCCAAAVLHYGSSIRYTCVSVRR